VGKVEAWAQPGCHARRCPPADEIGGTLAAVMPSPVPGKRDVVVEYLLVNTEGKILAVLQSPAEVARQLARIESESEANESVRVVRHDEHRSDLAATESFVTAMPLASLLELRGGASRR
jgi:hypothetical protein